MNFAEFKHNDHTVIINLDNVTVIGEFDEGMTTIEFCMMGHEGDPGQIIVDEEYDDVRRMLIKMNEED